ncbi:MAG: hypothetical protein AB1Z57_12405 [Acidimicrobiia bacterium]
MLHTMRRSLVVAVVLLVALAAMPLALAGGGHERPFKEDLTGYGMPPIADPVLVEARCGEGALWISTMTGTGTITHLGRVTWEAEHCFYDDFMSFGASELTITAANGDQLFGTYTGSMTGPTTWLDDLTIVGGTGRFEGATGEVAESGWYDPDTEYMEITGEGWIAYAPGR